MYFNSMEMRGGIASDAYSMFSKDNPSVGLDNFFQHSYETIGGGGGHPGSAQPQQQSQHQQPKQQQQEQFNGGNSSQSDSRSSQKQNKFEQELAMKKAMRDQDIVAPVAKTNSLPQNFNEMWEQQSRK
jgi:hypothetical protein